MKGLPGLSVQSESSLDLNAVIASRGVVMGAALQLCFCACRERSMVRRVVLVSATPEPLLVLLHAGPDEQQELVKTIVARALDSEGQTVRVRIGDAEYSATLGNAPVQLSVNLVPRV